jgi:dethiobiotin synthetase
VRVVVVTGTDTGVGKTVVTAALACGYAGAGSSVTVVKPVQTGALPGEAADLAEITRLSGVRDTVEPVRLPDPLAPDTAARRAGVRLPSVAEQARVVAGRSADVVLVEGAGGLLVRLDSAGETIAGLALHLVSLRLPIDVVVVVRAGLGTLNHTALTVEALGARGLSPAGLVIGSWPAEPGLAERCNLDDLPLVTGVPLLGRVAEGAGALDADAFSSAVPTWLPVLP